MESARWPKFWVENRCRIPWDSLAYFYLDDFEFHILFSDDTRISLKSSCDEYGIFLRNRTYRKNLSCHRDSLLFLGFHCLKAVFHWAEFSVRSNIFSSKISTLNFDFISTSILLKANTVRKRRNTMSAVEKRLALKKLLVLIALLRRRIQREEQNIGKGFGSDIVFEEQNEKGQFLNIF